MKKIIEKNFLGLKKEDVEKMLSDNYVICTNKDLLYNLEDFEVLTNLKKEDLKHSSDFTLEQQKKFDYIWALINECILITSINEIRNNISSAKNDYSKNIAFVKEDKNIEIKLPKKTQFNTVNKEVRYSIGYYILLQEKLTSYKKQASKKATELKKANEDMKYDIKEQNNFKVFTCNRLNHELFVIQLQFEFYRLQIEQLMFELKKKIDVTNGLYSAYCNKCKDLLSDNKDLKQALYINAKQCYNIELSSKDIDTLVFLTNTKITSVTSKSKNLKGVLNQVEFQNDVIHNIGSLLISAKIIDLEVYRTNQAFMQSIKDCTIQEIAEKAQELCK